MGVRIIKGKDEAGTDVAVIYCSTTSWAFGPVFSETENGLSGEDLALSFLQWLPQDAREYSDVALERQYQRFISMVEDQLEEEDLDAIVGFIASGRYEDLSRWLIDKGLR